MLGLVASLSACQQEPSPTDLSSVAPSLTAPTAPMQQEANETGDLTAAIVTPPPSREPLNLAIPGDILEEQPEHSFPEHAERLPDLFARKARAGKSISGELLFEPGERASLDSMDGAKISIRIPTGD
ncbi:MAG: hypothetical protein V2J89_16990 [Halieaceae bacterium]|jgi:hypothetical protein|nr:hypothetical protein [Halieaceae bacterium]